MVSGREAVRAFERLGWEVDRRPRQGHIALVKAGNMATLSVPDHKELGRGILRALIRLAGLSPEEFRAALG